MLDKFRENASSAVIQFAILAVAVVFIFSFGPGSRGCGADVQTGTHWAAEVNGETIPASTFNRAFANEASQRSRYRGGTYSNSDAKADNLREEVMKQVVEAELLAQAGLREGLAISDDELADFISKQESFQTNGVFDPEVYRKYVINGEGISPAKFEERLRRSLLSQRTLELVLGSTAVSDDEVKSEFVRNNEAATMEYVRFTPAQFSSDIAVTDADVDAYLAAHKDDVKKKYEETRFQYVSPRGIKARRLHVSVRQDAEAAAEADAKSKIEAAAAALKAGKSWDDALAMLPDDAAAEAGGDLGWVELGRSPYGRKLEEETFKLKKGERSEVFRDLFGFHLVEATDDRPATEKKLEEVEKDVAKVLVKEERAKALAKQAAEAALAKLAAGESLATQFPKTEKPEGAPPTLATKPEVAVADEFRPNGGFLPGIGNAPALTAKVFSLAGDRRRPDAPVEDMGSYFVFQLTSRTRADLTKLDDAQKAQIRERLRGQKLGDLKKTWVEELRKSAKVTENAALLSYERREPGVDQPFDF